MVTDDDVRLDRLDEATFPEFRRAFGATFGHEPSAQDLERHNPTVEYDRGIVARDDRGDIVGTSGAYSFTMSVPGGGSVGCAGITVVSVRQDRRRRGLLTRMMGQLLQDAVEREEPVAALWASESPIYGRYGFGPAAPTLDLEVERAHSDLRATVSTHDVELVGADEARRRLPPIHESWRRSRGGIMGRNQGWWQRLLDDPEHRREGAGPRRHAVLGDRGFATFRLQPRWEGSRPDGTVHLDDLVALDAEAAATLWRFAFDTDLAARLHTSRVAVDDPLLLLLADPQRASIRQGMALQLRLVDVAAAFGARRYLDDGEIVVEVRDEQLPGNAGRWRLTVEDGEGVLSPAGSTDADLYLDAESLGTVYLGGVRATQLLAAGRIRGGFEAAADLDRLLAVATAPTSDLMF